MRWFRFYDCVVDDPKVQRLPPDLFRFWVNCLCLASANAGRLPAPADMAFALRTDETSVSKNVSLLIECGLFDEVKKSVEPHNWRKRQFKSDTSTDRVKRFRKRSETAPVTPPESEQIQNRTEQKKDARGARFDEFWLVCPRKIGRAAAEKAWNAAVKAADPDALIGAMRGFAGRSQGTDEKYIPGPVMWLTEKRWLDEEGGAPPLDAEAMAANIDRADRLMRRGKYAPAYG